MISTTLLEDIKYKLGIINNKRHRTKNEKIKNLIKNDLITTNIKKFFSLNALSQIMEEKNPLSELTHKRKLTYAAKNSRNLSMREIHPSQFGKICPIQTTEGKNAGLILSFANNYELSKNGFIRTPFFVRLNNNQQKRR